MTQPLIARSLACALVFGALASVPAAALAQPRTASAYVVLAGDKLKIKPESTVQGNIGVNEKFGVLKLAKDAEVTGATVGDKVRLGAATVFDVYANNLKLKPSATNVLGSLIFPVPGPVYQTEPLVVPDPFDSANFPPAFPISCGSGNVDIEGTSMTLSPGTYGEIRLRNGGSLTLQGGTYNICVLNLNDEAETTGPVVLNLKERLLMGHDSTLVPQNGSDSITVNIAGQRPSFIGEDARFDGELFAPVAKLKVGNRANITGQLVARSITVKKNVLIAP